MKNKYLYISSLGIENNNHADFEVSFPEVFTIDPYSSVRCVSCRINPPDNSIEIDKTNNTILVSLDYWNKVNSCIPFIPIVLSHEVYDLQYGSANNDFNQEIQLRCNDAFEDFAFARNGFQCSITNQRITLKFSPFQVYSLPFAAFTPEVWDYWTWDDNQSVKNNKYTLHEYNNCGQKQGITEDENTIRCTILSKGNDPYYYVSPWICQGFYNHNIDQAGNTKDNAPLSSYFELDFSKIELEDDEYITITDGFCEPSTLDNTDSPYNWGLDETPISPHRWCVTFKNNDLNIRYVNKKGAVKIFRMEDYEYNNTKKYSISCQEYEDGQQSYFRVTVKETSNNFVDTTQLGQYETPKFIGTFRQTIIHDESISRPSLHLGILANFDASAGEFIRASFAVDDQKDKGRGYILDGENSGFKARSSLERDFFRPLTVISELNISDASNGNSLDIPQSYYEDFKENTAPVGDGDMINRKYTLPAKPCGNDWGFESDGMEFVYFNNNNDPDLIYANYTDGIEAEDNVTTNSRTFPQFYLSVDLPLENYSCNPLVGKKVQFVCPIDLNPSATHNRLYTSKLYTDNYNQMTNSYPLSLTTLKIRICHINGTVVKGLDPYTILTLEIKSPEENTKYISLTPSGQKEGNLTPYNNQ